MDFVVVGLGLGACAVLAGVILLGWCLPRAERTLARSREPESIARAEAGVTATRGAGQVMLSAGGAIFLATIGALAGSLDDRTGAFLVVTTVTVAALGILVWGYRNRNRLPWLAPRQRVRPVPAAAAEAPAPLLLVPLFADPLAEPNGTAAEPAVVAATADDDDAEAIDRDEIEPAPDDGEAMPPAASAPTEDDAARLEVVVGGRAGPPGTDDDPSR